MLEIVGETSMSWTQFTATMKDGKRFQFGTAYHDEFFDMPVPYSGADIASITPAERFARPQPGVPIFREKPFFECYIDGL
jgi:hypothetical protein